MFFNFNTVTQWIDNLLGSVMPGWAATLVECVLVALAVITLYAVFAIILIYMERKICAFFQCRLGPMRVGKWGSIQVVSDVLKMLTKEIIDLKNVDRLLHKMAPFLVIIASMLTFSCLPWNKGAGIIDFNVGIVFFLASGSIGVVGILLAGWSSNNKYALIGAMRSGAQIISYEVSIGLTMLSMIVLTGTMSFSEICQQQSDFGWNIVRGHIPAVLAFIVYLIAGNAECNRGPFDMPEAEHELTAGYHTEYSGIHFGFFYLAEYLNLFIVSGIASLMFLGGWMPLHIPGWDAFNTIMDYIPSVVWFLGKAFFVSFLLIWIRWTYPRVRIDQMLALEWKYLMPIGLVNLVVMALCVTLGFHF